MNNGVQGGSQVSRRHRRHPQNPTEICAFQIFKHTFNTFRQQGYPPREVQLQVAFGKGDGFWTNVFSSKLVQRYSGDVRKFGFFLKVIKWTMPFLGLVPISTMLRLFFSRDFGDKMVYPLIALFLGTGNQTPHVPSAIVERLFDDPNMKLWDYDPVILLPNLPTMFTFDHLDAFYRTWRQDLESKCVTIRTRAEVSKVLSRVDGVKLRVRDTAAGTTTEENFDDIVLCVLADESLRILGKQATWREKLVLGGATFYDDITVTHSDQKYFEKQYETAFDPELCAEPTSYFQRKQIAFAKGQAAGQEDSSSGFQPMYYTFSYQDDPRLIEMSFNCSNYQHQLRKPKANATGSFEPVYQTIFLNKDMSHLWTINEIDEARIIKKNWWHQLGHRWQHYLRVVPGMMFLNGRNRTYFAGSWTLVVSRSMSLSSRATEVETPT